MKGFQGFNPEVRPGPAPPTEGSGPFAGVEALQGVVGRVTFHNPESHYAVVRLESQPGGVPVTLVGHFDPLPAAGEQVRVLGRWSVHPIYGRQFQAQACYPVGPTTLEGIERFLACGAVRGVGPATARRLVERFGERTLDVIVAEPDRLATVPGIGPRKARSISEQVARQRARYEELVFLMGLGVGPGLAGRIARHYGPDAIGAVRRNPYLLALQVDGIGFRRADEVARRFGVRPDDPQRVEAGLWHVLQAAVEDGHLFLPQGVLFERARELLFADLLQVPAAGPADWERLALEAAARLAGQGWVAVEEGAYYPARLHRFEVELAGHLAGLVRHRIRQAWLPDRLASEVAVAEQELGTRLAPAQREAVQAALEEGVLVVTGGPGTGKTTLVRFIVRVAAAVGWKVVLAAPTGRAAQRLNEAVFGHGPPPPGMLAARTIHRLLEPRLRPAAAALPQQERVPGATSGPPGQGSGGEGLEFGRNAQHPLDVDLLVVDEASMLDVPLAVHLLRALRPGSRLVLVGDVNQLPSVGPGQVLRDIIEAGVVKVVRLSRIFRQSARSSIVVGAHQILAGRSIVSPGTGHSGVRGAGAQGAARLAGRPGSAFDGELRFIEVDEPGECARRVQELVSVILPQRFGLDPLRDIQVLAATHRGPAGCDALNELLQLALNPPSPRRPELEVGTRRLRLGDRVIQSRNDYRARVVAPVESPGEEGEPGGVFNGEIGRIGHVDVLNRRLQVRFEDGRVVEYDERQMGLLRLAYAVTVHKSQGNEFACVVMPVVWTMPALMTRHLLYTAVTRGRKLVVLVGQRKAVQAYVRNASVAWRYTRLAERLQKAGGSVRPCHMSCEGFP